MATVINPETVRFNLIDGINSTEAFVDGRFGEWLRPADKKSRQTGWNYLRILRATLTQLNWGGVVVGR